MSGVHHVYLLRPSPDSHHICALRSPPEVSGDCYLVPSKLTHRTEM